MNCKKIWQYPPATGLQAGLDLLMHTDLRAPLAQLTCPALYLLGSLDSLLSINIASALMLLNYKLQVKIITGADHILFLSHTTEFLELINAFIQST